MKLEVKNALQIYSCPCIPRHLKTAKSIQLFQLTLSEEKQKAYKARLHGNMGFL